jgi:beta-lactamase regulating signal transducer with metallopeptidase domain
MIASWLGWLSQGLVLALALGAALRLVPRVNAITRCALWWFLLVMIAVMGLPLGRPSHLSPLAAPSPLLLIPSPPDPLPIIFAAAWAVFALLFLLRVLAAVRAICAMKDGCRPLSPRIEEQLPLWRSVRSRGRRADLVVSESLRSATVLGYRRPCIALPSFLVEALTPTELDQVVLHEYAHVRRWDDWTRLAQTLLHAALWMHPAALLASWQLNWEREVACDEWVVARTGKAKAYARCLASAAEARSRYAASGFGQSVTNLTSPALFGREGELSHRIDRLLAIDRAPRPALSMWAAASGACAILALALQLRVVPVVAEVGAVGWLPVPHAPIAWLSAPAAPPDVSVRRAGLERQEPPYSLQDPPYNLQDPPHAQGTNLQSGRSGPEADRLAGLEPQDPPYKSPSTDVPVLPARTYVGGYVDPGVAHPEPGRERGWGSAGLAIGAAGRKTGLGVAAVFTRAGVSLARRF